MSADDRIELDGAQAGDIVALVGLKNVQTGHTLCDKEHPATLEPMVFPDPVISIAVAPVDKANAEKLGTAIGKMVKEDPHSSLKLTSTQAKPSSKEWASFTSTLR